MGYGGVITSDVFRRMRKKASVSGAAQVSVHMSKFEIILPECKESAVPLYE